MRQRETRGHTAAMRKEIGKMIEKAGSQYVAKMQQICMHGMKKKFYLYEVSSIGISHISLSE